MTDGGLREAHLLVLVEQVPRLQQASSEPFGLVEVERRAEPPDEVSRVVDGETRSQQLDGEGEAVHSVQKCAQRLL